jgi:hypothetical protein
VLDERHRLDKYSASVSHGLYVCGVGHVTSESDIHRVEGV